MMQDVNLNRLREKSNIDLSVIIPCFNQGEFILEALASVEKCGDALYEIIIVNDGSTEPLTQNVLSSLRSKGYWVIDQSNQGVSKARNTGIKIAKGKYILALDADNKIRHKYITKGIEILDNNPEVGVVYGNSEFFGKETGVWEVPDFDFTELLVGNYIDACAVFRKTVWQECGGYDPNILGHEDWEFWIHAAKKGWKFHHVPEVLFDYHVRSNSKGSFSRLPENRKKIVKYICNKHLDLFTPNLAGIIAGKDFFALSERQRAENYQAQVQAIQIELEKTQLQLQQTQAELEGLKLERSPTLAASYTPTVSVSELPLVSICIPTYNGEDFIAEALSSALSQTYPKIEIIISDDNSTDRTIEFATSFQKKVSVNFSITTHKQYGLVHNWNFCISQSKGKYIKFLFQDDLLEPDCIEEMVNLAEQDNDIGLVFSQRKVVLSGEANSNSTCMEVYLESRGLHKEWSNLKDIQLGQELLRDPKLLQTPVNKIGEPSTVLVRKKVFDTVGLFDTELYQLVDVDMWLRIMGHYKIGFVDKPLSSFRIHPQQQTHKNIHNKEILWLDGRNFYNKLYSHHCYNFLDSGIRQKAFLEYAVFNEKYSNLRALMNCYSRFQYEVVVSIIIPCFNQGEFILDAIASVESCQDAVYEVIIVNDGSTDAVTQKVLSYLESRGYCVIHQSNKGVAQARNAAIEIARGRYILPLDADNKLRETYLKQGIKVLDKFSDVGVVYGKAEYFGEKTGTWEVTEFNITHLLNNNYIDTCAIFRKSVWQDCGGYDPCLEIQGLEDWDFWLYAVENGWKFYYVPEVLFDYRVRSDSLSSRFRNPEIYQKAKRYIYSKHINLYTQFTPSAARENLMASPQAELETLPVQQQLTQKQDVAEPNLVDQTPTGSVPARINYPSIEPIHEGKDRPFWSVMIPTYNNAKYLEQTLKSVLEQDTNLNEMQIEVVDDCSSGNDIESVVRKIGQNRIGFYKQPQNVGLSANWNTCIRRARGHWVHILHQDDIVLPGFYSRLREALEKEVNIGAAFCRHAFIDEKGEQLFLSPFERETSGILSYWLERLAVECRIQCAAIVVRRSVYEQLGGFHPELVYALDWDMWKRIAAHYSFWYEPQPLACYRLWHSSSESSRLMKSGANVADLRKSIEISQSYLPEMIAAELSSKARENWALGALDTARRMISVGDTVAAMNQIREGLKCSNSSKITSSLAYLLFQSPESNSLLAVLSDCAAQPKKDSTDLSPQVNLRQSRMQIAQQWLNIPAEQLESMYLGAFGQEHRTLLNSSIKSEPLTYTEQSFVKELETLVARGFYQLNTLRYLLAAMLYRRADQLLLPYDFSQIPNWFLNDYLKFIFTFPICFSEIGEVDRYYSYLHRWISYLNTKIFSNQDSIFWQDIALYFTLNISLIPFYLAPENLKYIYTQRADIMEFGLKNHAHQIDYIFPERPADRRKIRLGFLTHQFELQTETFAILPAFEYLDRNQFEIILYTLTIQGNQLEQYCQNRSDRLVKLPNDLRNQVQNIRADDLDILLIGTNVTAATTMITLLALHRLARVQIAGFNTAVTTGMRTIDYYLSGNLAQPIQRAKDSYREQLIPLNGSGFCLSYPLEFDTPTIKLQRQSLGIPDQAIVFVSSANLYKIIPELRDTWARIVAAVPDSFLVLLPFSPGWSHSYPEQSFINQMRTVFSKYDIANNRLLVIGTLQSCVDVKEVLKLGDVYLGSYPYSGTASVVEALEVALPTVVREGKFLPSRMGAALLREIQVYDLIADSEAAYVDLAIALATNPELRQQKRLQIQQKMQENPSFLDSRSYAAQLGDLFQEIITKFTH